MTDLTSENLPGVAGPGPRPGRKRWTTPRVILSEMVLQQVGAPVNPAVAPHDVKGGGSTASGDGS
jgi:hypothetical protein